MSEQKQFDMREKYYESLLNQHYDTHKTYDKIVLTLSGGALSFSLLFKEKVGLTSFPTFSWYCWMLSLLILLISMYLSTLLYRKALEDFYNEEKSKKEEKKNCGMIIISILNASGGILFILGLGFFFICI
jgi:hypothetical protein